MLLCVWPQSTGNKVYAGTRARAEHKQRATKSHTLWDQNGRRGVYARKAIPGNPAITSNTCACSLC